DWGFTPPLKNPRCPFSETYDLCPPKVFAGLQHKLFKNNAGGSFSDVTQNAGLRPGGEGTSKGVGCIAADFNGDGKPDIYVANDAVDSFLYMNESQPGRIRFREVGFPAGVARDGSGVANASMGVAVGDPDACLRPSLFVTNYENELHGY